MKRQDMNMKLEFFRDNKTKLHIVLFNDFFYNGYIFDITLDKDLMVFTDDKLGNMPVLFEEIKRVEPFTEVRDKGVEDGRD